MENAKNLIVYQAIDDYNPFGGEKPRDGEVYDTHIKKIELLRDSNEIKKVIEIFKNGGENVDGLDKDKISKTYFDNTDVILYSASLLKDKKKKKIIFTFKELTQVAKTEIKDKGENQKSQFILMTSDSNPIITMDVQKTEGNKLNKLTNVKSHKNEVFTRFSDEVYKIQTDNKIIKKEEDCCRHESYSDCVECTASNIVGIAVLAFFDGEGLIAIGVSCIGSGPNASC